MRGSESWARFLALWPTFHRLIVDDGYSVRAIHRAAVAEGAWSGGYTVFRRHVARALRERGDLPQGHSMEPSITVPVPAAPPVAPPVPRIPTLGLEGYPGVSIHPSALDGPEGVNKKR